MRLINDQPLKTEFIDANGLRMMFGISRSHAYALTAERKIRSASIRRPGSVRGKRLWLVDSVRDYLNSCMDDYPLISSDQSPNKGN
jgi:hypothetical protein